MLRFTLFGGIGVAFDGRQAKLAVPGRGIALLAYVLLQGSGRTRRDRLATTLWPDETETDGRAKLRRMLYLIGQALPAARSAEWIVSEGTSLLWNPAIARGLDLDDFREAVASEGPRDTTSLYRGDLLPEFDDEWLLAERDRLRERHVANLERLAGHHAAARSHAAARAALAEILRWEPWREDVMRLSIEMRVAGGDRAGALADYELFAKRLRDELGVDPMPETLALRARLTQVAARATAPPDDRIFIGRERELSQLAERYAELEAGRGGLVLVGGESGVGKSELIARHCGTIAERGGRVISAATTFVETRPYQPFVAALRSALEHLGPGELSPVMTAARDRLLSGGRVRVSDETFASESVSERARLFEGVAGVFQALALRQPLVIALEDLHWAGNDTVAMLEYIVRRVARSCVLVVASYRDGDVPRAHPLRAMRRRLQEETLVTNVRLGPLGSRDVQRFLEATLGASTEAEAERYLAASGGLPIILVGLAADRENGGAGTAVPAAMHGDKLRTLASRLDALSPEARLVLEIAAVAGLGFDAELLVEVSGWTEAEVHRHLSAATGRRIIREAVAGGYGFAHDLFRELMYDAMPASRRASRHALVAEALRELHAGAVDERAPELAMHYERAGDSARAIDALRTAALRARAVFAHDDAGRYASRALAAGATGRTGIELLLIREDASRARGDVAAQRADLQRAEESALALADDGVLAEILLRSNHLDFASGGRDGEVQATARLEAVCERAGGAWRVRCDLLRANRALAAGRHAMARPLLEAAAAAFERLGDARGIFETALLYALCERLSGDLDAIGAHFATAEAQLAVLGDARKLIVELCSERANTALNQDRYAEARLWAGRFLEGAREIGSVAGIAAAHRLLGGAAAWQFDLVTAGRHLDEALRLYEMLGRHGEATTVIAFRGLLECRVGLYEASVATLQAARDLARKHEYPMSDGICSNNLAHVLILLARYEEARGAASASLEIAARTDYELLRGSALINLGVATRELGLAAESLPLLREACEITERLRRFESAAEAWAERALSARLTGDDAEATLAADRARAVLDRLPPATRPVDKYVTMARVYHGHDAALEARYLQEGAQLLRAVVNRLPDADSKRAVRDVAAYRGLLATSDDFRTAPA